MAREALRLLHVNIEHSRTSAATEQECCERATRTTWDEREQDCLATTARRGVLRPTVRVPLLNRYLIEIQLPQFVDASQGSTVG
jgi:hypothetical protein